MSVSIELEQVGMGRDREVWRRGIDLSGRLGQTPCCQEDEDLDDFDDDDFDDEFDDDFEDEFEEDFDDDDFDEDEDDLDEDEDEFDDDDDDIDKEAP